MLSHATARAVAVSGPDLGLGKKEVRKETNTLSDTVSRVA